MNGKILWSHRLGLDGNSLPGDGDTITLSDGSTARVWFMNLIQMEKRRTIGRTFKWLRRGPNRENSKKTASKPCQLE